MVSLLAYSASKAQSNCTPGRPKTVSTLSRFSDSTSAWPPVIRGIVSLQKSYRGVPYPQPLPRARGRGDGGRLLPSLAHGGGAGGRGSSQRLGGRTRSHRQRWTGSVTDRSQVATRLKA